MKAGHHPSCWLLSNIKLCSRNNTLFVILWELHGISRASPFLIRVFFVQCPYALVIPVMTSGMQLAMMFGQHASEL